MFRSNLVLLARCLFYGALLGGCYLAFSPGGTNLHAHFNDKLLHAAGFFVMMGLAHFAYPYSRRGFVIIGLALFGVFIELVQAYLPYRSFSLADWVADLVGIFMYQLLVMPWVTGFFSKYRYGLD